MQYPFFEFVRSVQRTEEEIQGILAQLEEPFDPEQIQFKPQTVNYSDNTAMAAAYANPRAYVDRLNEVVGVQGWTSWAEIIPTSGFNKSIKQKVDMTPDDPGYKPDYKGKQTKNVFQIVPAGQLVVTVTVAIAGIGCHQDVGQEPGESELAATAASAQAFKRACYHFGLGRYLYDFPKIYYPFDTKTNKFKVEPPIPEQFLPKFRCEHTGTLIEPVVVKGETWPVSRIVALSRKKYGKVLSLKAMQELALKDQNQIGNRLPGNHAT